MLEIKRNPMSGGMPHVKTDFRKKNGLNHVQNKENAGKPLPTGQVGFKYPGTDKGVKKC